MSTLYIKPWMEQQLRQRSFERYGKDIVEEFHCVSGEWYHRHYVKFLSVFNSNRIHYEYKVEYGSCRGYIELHVEDKTLANISKELYNKTVKTSNEMIEWREWWGLPKGCCRYKLSVQDSLDDLFDRFDEFRNYLDPLIQECLHKGREGNINKPYDEELVFKETFKASGKKVDVFYCTLEDLFSVNLTVPGYQRDYCWEDESIKSLWDSIKDVDKDYHLGTIILQQKGGEFHIIDGQQRLVTLTLLMRALGYAGQMPLLKQTFNSANSKDHIANAKFLITGIAGKVHDLDKAGTLVRNLTFSVLILQDGNLDLAYTFFSNQNSRGIPLSDYDLLKAHHLRYIPVVIQAEHLAKRWNRMICDTLSNKNMLELVLGTHLFRLRKWFKQHTVDSWDDRKIKKEFSAARLMEGIPAFGEQFLFYDKIQGGTHFFAYSEHFVELFKEFEGTHQVNLLRKHLGYGQHVYYASVIETLLFGYYIKFGRQYLSEALYCICGVIGQHRYTNARALPYKIRQYAQNSELVMMIVQASSPTFFLADALNSIRVYAYDCDLTNVQDSFFRVLMNIFRSIHDFTDVTIKQMKDNEY